MFHCFSSKNAAKSLERTLLFALVVSRQQSDFLCQSIRLTGTGAVLLLIGQRHKMFVYPGSLRYSSE